MIGKPGAGRFLAAVLVVVTTACSSGSDPATTTTSDSTAPSTTTSSSIVSTTTLAPPVAISIVTPEPLTTFLATIDLGDGRLAAPVQLVAEIEIPAGETVEVVWASDVDGPLGSGSVLDVELSTGSTDVVSHRITATVESSGGGVGIAEVEIIVQVPSN